MSVVGVLEHVLYQSSGGFERETIVEAMMRMREKATLNVYEEFGGLSRPTPSVHCKSLH